MDREREIADATLQRAREALEDLSAAVAEHGSSPRLDKTRASLEAEIQTLQAALNDWDAWFSRLPRDRERAPRQRLDRIPAVESDPKRALLDEMSDSFNRLELMVADLHPADETNPAKAELITNMKLELASLRSGIEELKQALGG